MSDKVTLPAVDCDEPRAVPLWPDVLCEASGCQRRLRKLFERRYELADGASVVFLP